MNKNFLFILTILMVLCTLSAVSASEINCTDDVVDSDCDILSASPASTVTVSTWSDLSNACTNSTQYDIIYVNGNMAPSSAITINKNVVIEGVNGSYIGGTSSNFVTYSNIPFSTSSALNVTFKNMNFQYTGGNILMKFGGNGNYVLDGCTFKNITAVGVQKSVVHLYYGLGNIVDCTFENCTTSYGVVTNCYSTSETTVNRARMYVSNCEFRNNNATIEPGAINNCGYLEVYDSIFENNYATQWAGAIHTHIFANTTIVNSTFRNNRAGWNGGSLFTYSYLQVYNSTFTENQADAFGGAIGACKYAVKNWMGVWINSTYTILIKNSQFISNSASTNGGAIGVMDEGILRVQNNIFTNNVASTGRAISASDSVIYEDNWTDITSPTVEIIGNQFYDPTSTLPNVLVYGVDATYLLDNNAFYLSSSPSGFNEPLLGLSQDEVLGDGNSPAQWAQEGADAQNTGISPYAGIINGELSWNYTPSSEGNINSLLITNDGQIFTTTTDGYVIRLSNSGNQNTKGKPRDQNMQFAITNIYGVALDNNNYFILPSANTENTEGNYIQSWGTDVAFDNMQTLFPYLIDGTYLPVWNYEYENAYLSNFNPVFDGSNMWVIGDNGQYYVMKYAYVLCPDPSVAGSDMYYYKWDTSLNLNNIGKPLSSLVKSNDGKSLWINTENGIEGYDISTSTASKYAITSVNAVGRPIIDANDVVYFIGSDDKLYAYTTAGEKWSTEISGGAGSLLALGKDGNIYTVSKEGFLLQFSPDGDDTSLYEIGTNASSIMTDANNIIYIGGEDGKFYAVSGDKLKWSVDTESASAIKYVAMDNSGIIYFATDKTVYATLEAPVILKNVSIEVSLPEGNYSILDEVTITATLNETVEGNVTFTAGDLIQVVAVNGNTTEWTTALPAGNQTVTATFEGDGYETAIGTATVNIAKADVEFEKVPEVLTYDSSKSSQLSFNFNILSNGANVTTGTIAGYDENNNKLSGIWRYYANRGWTATIRNVAPGYHNITIVYSGDTNYNGANTTFELISLPTVTSSVNIGDEEITVDVSVSGTDASGKFTVVCNNETLAEGDIENGVGSVTFDKLEPGNYELQIIYEGNEFIPANNGTAKLKIPRTSQWASVGGDAQNSGNSISTREYGVSILWNASLEGDLIYSAVIDSFGNVYVTDGINIYSFANDGNLIWSASVQSWSGGPGSSGIALYHDEAITSPQSGNAMLVFNATDGTQFGGNYWSASSAFAPIVGPDGRVYTPSEYGYPADGQGWSGDYWISVLSESGDEWQPYEFNLFLVEVTGVSYGSQAMKASPSFDNEGFIYANTVKGFKIVNIATGTTVFSDAGINGVGRPVIDANNIAFILDSTLNGIYAISTEGIVWNTTVTGGIGTTLAVDNENGFLYSVNAEGTLYKYSTTDGSEIKVCDLNSTGVSIILDAGNNVYISTDGGDVVALSADDELLWTINLASSISGQMAMDNNGVIYVCADDTLYALGYLKYASVVADDLVINATTDALINYTTTPEGLNVTFVADDSGVVSVSDDGIVSALKAGVAKITIYVGDGKEYAINSTEISVTVNKIDTILTVDDVRTVYNTTRFVVATLTDDLGVGQSGVKVKIVVGNLTKIAETDENGQVSLDITTLEPGEYAIRARSSGINGVYSESKAFAHATVYPEKLDTTLTVSDVYVIGNSSGIVVATLKDDEGKVLSDIKVKIVVDKLSVTAKTDANGQVSLDISSLAPGEYKISARSSGVNDLYKEAKATAKAVVSEDKLDATLTVPDVVVVGDSGVVIATLKDSDGKAISGVNVKIVVDKLSVTAKTDANGQVSLDISGLAPGQYKVSARSSGVSYIYKEAKATAKVIVSEDKLDATLTIPDVVVVGNSSGVVVATLKDSYGNLISGVNVKLVIGDLTVNAKTDENGQVSVDVSGLAPGVYKVSARSSGVSDIYKEAKAYAKVIVSEEKLDTTLTIPDVVVDGSSPAVVVATLKDSYNYRVSGVNVKITVGDLTKTAKTDENGQVSLDISSLAPGNYKISARSSGVSDIYNESRATAKATVKAN